MEDGVAEELKVFEVVDGVRYYGATSGGLNQQRTGDIVNLRAFACGTKMNNLSQQTQRIWIVLMIAQFASTNFRFDKYPHEATRSPTETRTHYFGRTILHGVQKTVEDFEDWTSWLLHKGGVGVKEDNSWESWWDKEQIFTYNPKKSVDFQLVLRFSQGVASIGLVAVVCLVVAFTPVSIADLFASILAFIPTGWGILSDDFGIAHLVRVYQQIDRAQNKTPVLCVGGTHESVTIV
ncbi:hypothetical protein JHK82_022700 [Glycine max]|nr:hypothetical protein JHK85_023191 [Glycine max]KAG5137969.1 hypothetical protein JHK82_022700 [Glycine max]